MLRRSLYIFLGVSNKKKEEADLVIISSFISIQAHWIWREDKQIRVPRDPDYSPRCPLDQGHVPRDARWPFPFFYLNP